MPGTIHDALRLARRPTRVMTCVALAAASTVLASGCGTSGGSGDEVLTAVRPAEIVMPAEREITTVVDPSQSFPREYLVESLRVLAGAVRALPVRLPPTGAFAGAAGVHFSLRSIGGDSYAPSAMELEARIPGVPAIADITTGANGDIDMQGAVNSSEQRRAATVAAQDARTVADDLAAKLEQLELPVTHCSDIQGAVSAAAETFGDSPGAGHLLIVISDFDQSCDVNVSGSLEGVDFLGVLVCDDAVVCQERQQAWGERLRDARSARFVRLEEAAATVRDLLRGAS